MIDSPFNTTKCLIVCRRNFQTHFLGKNESNWQVTNGSDNDLVPDRQHQASIWGEVIRLTNADMRHQPKHCTKTWHHKCEDRRRRSVGIYIVVMTWFISPCLRHDNFSCKQRSFLEHKGLINIHDIVWSDQFSRGFCRVKCCIIPVWFDTHPCSLWQIIAVMDQN